MDKIISLLWPWAKIRKQRDLIAYLSNSREEALVEATDLKIELSQERSIARRQHLAIVDLKAQLAAAEQRSQAEQRLRDHLYRILGNAHFRDPSTGRIGPKGKVPGYDFD